MSDAWLSMLHALADDYDQLKYSMDHGPSIKPMLTNSGTTWLVTLQEIWDDGIEYQSISSRHMDQQVEWSTVELSRWTGVDRTAWDQWSFESQHVANKFITLFYLRWIP